MTSEKRIRTERKARPRQQAQWGGVIARVIMSKETQWRGSLACNVTNEMGTWLKQQRFHYLITAKFEQRTHYTRLRIGAMGSQY